MCGVPHHAARGYLAQADRARPQGRDLRAGRGPAASPRASSSARSSGSSRRASCSTRSCSTPRRRATSRRSWPSGPRRGVGLAYLDVTTGEFRADRAAAPARSLDELARVAPREVLADAELDGGAARPRALPRRAGTRDRAGRAAARGRGRGARSATLAGRASAPLALRAAAAAVALRARDPAGRRAAARRASSSTRRPTRSSSTRRATRTSSWSRRIVGRASAGSLLDVLDETRTALGGAAAAALAALPAASTSRTIRRRQDAVERLVERAGAARRAARARSREIADLERLAGRRTLGVATPRDLGRAAALARAAARARSRSLAPRRASARPAPGAARARRRRRAGARRRSRRDIAAALRRRPARRCSKDGGFVRARLRRELDELSPARRRRQGRDPRASRRASASAPASRSLKVRYNRVFGYYIEVTRAQPRARARRLHPQADGRQRRALRHARARRARGARSSPPTSGASRSSSSSFEPAARRGRRGARARSLRAGARASRALDALAALAEVAHRRGYCRPDRRRRRRHRDRRRPPPGGRAAGAPPARFVPNDVPPRSRRRAAPASSPAPTWPASRPCMRQVALIVLLAQIGVVRAGAARARSASCDRVFTRVGAADNLARGESTFMVEMRETAHDPRATRPGARWSSSTRSAAAPRPTTASRSPGRSPSTCTIAIGAQDAVRDALPRAVRARRDADRASRNVSVAVREHEAGEIVFLRRVVPGGAQRSYGIEVARLAGLPRERRRARRQILGELEESGGPGRAGNGKQLSLLGAAATPPPPTVVEMALAAIDPDRMTPLQALQALAELKILLNAKT